MLSHGKLNLKYTTYSEKSPLVIKTYESNIICQAYQQTVNRIYHWSGRNVTIDK